MGIFAEYRQINKLLKNDQGIVIYAENRYYHIYFEHLIVELLKKGERITYITSDKDDPLLKNDSAQMKVVYSKWTLAFLFSKLRARVMIMTMPDLNNFIFKKSAGVGCYVYLFHAAVSTHQQYRREAFFHYDAILCTGQYQVNELRAAELKYKQNTKQLIPYGYPLFNDLRPDSKDDDYVLVAPSWYKGSIFDLCLEPLLESLASLPNQVVLRAHPEFRKRNLKQYESLVRSMSTRKNVRFDTNPHVTVSLRNAAALVTDRSGIAFEYAFGKMKPVLFIDTAHKETNPDWRDLGIEPIENSIRSQLGLSLQPADVSKAAESIRELLTREKEFVPKLKNLKNELFFHDTTEAINFIIDKSKN